MPAATPRRGKIGALRFKPAPIAAMQAVTEQKPPRIGPFGYLSVFFRVGQNFSRKPNSTKTAVAERIGAVRIDRESAAIVGERVLRFSQCGIGIGETHPWNSHDRESEASTRSKSPIASGRRFILAGAAAVELGHHTGRA